MFKLLEHPYLSCRTCHTLALAQVAALLLNSCKTEGFKGFEISSWFLTQNGGQVDAKFFFCVHLVQIKSLPEEQEHVPACFNFL